MGGGALVTCRAFVLSHGTHALARWRVELMLLEDLSIVVVRLFNDLIHAASGLGVHRGLLREVAVRSCCRCCSQ